MMIAIVFQLILARYEVFKYQHLIFAPTRHALIQLLFLVTCRVEQIYPTKLMSHHQISLELTTVIKFCALGFHLIARLFQKIWRREVLKNLVKD